jgi:hypothetical protein
MAGKKSTTHVLVANQHTAPIISPRRTGGGAVLSAITFNSGMTTVVEKDVWDELKKNGMVRHYLDKKLLVEVKKEGPVAILAEATSEPEIPPHLKTAEEEGVVKQTATGKGAGQAKATVKKAEAGTVTVG